ncbi:hypothetical protein [Hymenobacter nivis]|uniref:Chaperone modulatory protein CbpM n=1 Tax=Hymenobacter nivis TaxID=1850093 RepID=A0A2Z3GQY1_9BACT|nr:hypothetical protein [Hymenobacter nivis]AWM34127.1 hypothetical protein DDQ68_15840 [Hymenobacter nivis]
MFVLTFQECAVRYGLNAEDLHGFVAVGLLRPAPTPNAVEIDDEPDELLPRLARLHHGLGVPPEALDLVLAMRQRLLGLQAALARETSRAQQLEQFLQGRGPTIDFN